MHTTQEKDGHESEMIELPAPTVRPMIVAPGMTLLGGGLVAYSGEPSGVVLAMIGLRLVEGCVPPPAPICAVAAPIRACRAGGSVTATVESCGLEAG
jgi:hypothetical protein